MYIDFETQGLKKEAVLNRDFISKYCVKNITSGKTIVTRYHCDMFHPCENMIKWRKFGILLHRTTGVVGSFMFRVKQLLFIEIVLEKIRRSRDKGVQFPSLVASFYRYEIAWRYAMGP